MRKLYRGDTVEFRYEMPIGFGMELMMNDSAMQVFSNLPETEKQKLLAKARSASSREEMTSLVKRLTDRHTFRL